jgi:hypothetical protein
MELVKCAWSAAADLLTTLGGYGPTHMELRVNGGEALGGPGGASVPVFGIGRASISSRPDQAILEGVERELRRSTGERVFEPLDSSGPEDV